MRDVCVTDYSWSLYDGTCGIAPSLIPTIHTVAPIVKSTVKANTVKNTTNKCYYSDGKIPTKKSVYQKVLLSPYKSDIMKLFNTCIIQ